MTSLLYIAIGYWRRPPARAARPRARARAARRRRGRDRASPTIGFALMQFLLGVDAPVSLLLLRQILVTILRQHAARAAGLRARAPRRAPARCPTTRAAAAAAPTRPAASRPLQRPSQRWIDRSAPTTAATTAARRSRRSSRCAWRSSAASRCALFAIVFFRLWYLQVLSGDQYLAQARDNRVRDIAVQAPRGEIVDRNGNVLVENRRAVAVVVSPPKLPADACRARHRAADAACTPRARRSRRRAGSSCKSRQSDASAQRHGRSSASWRRASASCPYADVTVKTDVSARRLLLPRRARAGSSRASRSGRSYLRHYPLRTVGAQLFGTVGQIDARS